MWHLAVVAGLGGRRQFAETTDGAARPVRVGGVAGRARPAEVAGVLAGDRRVLLHVQVLLFRKSRLRVRLLVVLQTRTQTPLEPVTVRVADGGTGAMEQEVVQRHDEESTRRRDAHERHDGVVVRRTGAVRAQVDRLRRPLAIRRRHHEQVLDDDERVEDDDFTLGTVLVVHGEVVERAVEAVRGDLRVRHLPHAAVDDGEAEQYEDEVRHEEGEQPRAVVVGEVRQRRHTRRGEQRLVEQHADGLTGGHVQLSHVRAPAVLVRRHADDERRERDPGGDVLDRVNVAVREHVQQVDDEHRRRLHEAVHELQLREHPLGLWRLRAPLSAAAVVAAPRDVDEALEDDAELQRHVAQPTSGHHAAAAHLLRVRGRLHDVDGPDGEAGQHEEQQPDAHVDHVLPDAEVRDQHHVADDVEDEDHGDDEEPWGDAALARALDHLERLEARPLLGVRRYGSRLVLPRRRDHDRRAAVERHGGLRVVRKVNSKHAFRWV